MQRHCDRQETQSGDEVVVVTTWRTAAAVGRCVVWAARACANASAPPASSRAAVWGLPGGAVRAARVDACCSALRESEEGGMVGGEQWGNGKGRGDEQSTRAVANTRQSELKGMARTYVHLAGPPFGAPASIATAVVSGSKVKATDRARARARVAGESGRGRASAVASTCRGVVCV